MISADLTACPTCFLLVYKAVIPLHRAELFANGNIYAMMTNSYNCAYHKLHKTVGAE